jgi:transposase InsO family protein
MDNDTVFINCYSGYRKSANPMRPRLHPFDVFCKELGVTHCLINPGNPAQYGKVERFHRSCKEEFYQCTVGKDFNSLRK